ncbi:hypothetical protein B566_EDAN008504 [Ephemera danica]|nr:hypothetical protein B566_EDAN008504 [Ephemera danica]
MVMPRGGGEQPPRKPQGIQSSSTSSGSKQGGNQNVASSDAVRRARGGERPGGRHQPTSSPSPNQQSSHTQQQQKQAQRRSSPHTMPPQHSRASPSRPSRSPSPVKTSDLGVMIKRTIFNPTNKSDRNLPTVQSSTYRRTRSRSPQEHFDVSHQQALLPERKSREIVPPSALQSGYSEYQKRPTVASSSYAERHTFRGPDTPVILDAEKTLKMTVGISKNVAEILHIRPEHNPRTELTNNPQDFILNRREASLVLLVCYRNQSEETFGADAMLRYFAPAQEDVNGNSKKLCLDTSDFEDTEYCAEMYQVCFKKKSRFLIFDIVVVVCWLTASYMFDPGEGTQPMFDRPDIKMAIKHRIQRETEEGKLLNMVEKLQATSAVTHTEVASNLRPGEQRVVAVIREPILVPTEIRPRYRESDRYYEEDERRERERRGDSRDRHYSSRYSHRDSPPRHYDSSPPCMCPTFVSKAKELNVTDKKTMKTSVSESKNKTVKSKTWLPLVGERLAAAATE